MTKWRHCWQQYRTVVLVQCVLHAHVGISATAGSHRLFVHQCYEARLPLRLFYITGSILGLSGDAIGWIKSHRTHHQYSDTELDPHNSRRGMFFSHFGWKMLEMGDAVKIARDKQDITTLKDPRIHGFVNKHYTKLGVLMNLCIPYLMVSRKFDGNLLRAVVLTSIIRVTVSINMAASVNSIAHKFGHNTENSDILPRNSLLVSVLSWGEGWHNYHHTYSKDYRASGHTNFVKYWNPAHAFINAMAKCKLAYNLKVPCSETDPEASFRHNGKTYKLLYNS